MTNNFVIQQINFQILLIGRVVSNLQTLRSRMDDEYDVGNPNKYDVIDDLDSISSTIENAAYQLSDIIDNYL